MNKFITLSALLFSQIAFAGWKTGSLVYPNGKTEVLFVQQTESRVDKAQELKRSYAFQPEDAPPQAIDYVEALYDDRSLPRTFRNFITDGAVRPDIFDVKQTEVRTLVNQGPPANRIDLTIVGDGYTLAEKDRFFEDAKRITDDLFAETTFSSYLALFNVHAVFVPSKESGITDGAEKKTALGLYRDPPGSKRAIMPGSTMAAESALALAPAADFPILLANDNYYGGLGGRYAITTRSVRSGSMVLRHELGHNFGNVGEEYDGGYVYSGANSSSGLPLSWQHWISGGVAKLFENTSLTGDYVWKNLKTGSYVSKFNFPSGAHHFEMLLSTVGWSTPDDVHVLIDGQKVAYDGEYTDDRSFFDVKPHFTLTPGEHKIEIRENVADGDNVLAFARVFAHVPDMDFSPGRVAGFATYDNWNNHAGYRPTFSDCLMRNMLSKNFCAADVENMWVRFLAQINLIDAVSVKGRQVAVQTPALAGLEIRWYQHGVSSKKEMEQYRDQAQWTAVEGLTGNFSVSVRFRTPEVKKETSRFEKTEKFRI